MSRVLLWAATGLLLLTACDEKPSAPAADTTTATATAAPKQGVPEIAGELPSSVSSKRPEAKDGKPKTDFPDLAEVVKASKAAVDRQVVVRGFLPHLSNPEGWSQVRECRYRGDRITLQVTFPEDKLAVMRALPRRKPNGDCPRIHVKLTGIDKKTGHPQGQIIDVYDIQPDPLPLNVPQGVDFISMDDMFLRGSGAVGKVADVAVRLDHKQDKSGVTYHALFTRGCAAHGSWDGHFWVAETDQTKAALSGIPKKPQCQRVQLRITAAPAGDEPSRWGAQLVGIGKKLRMPEPPPNP